MPVALADGACQWPAMALAPYSDRTGRLEEAEASLDPALGRSSGNEASWEWLSPQDSEERSPTPQNGQACAPLGVCD